MLFYLKIISLILCLSFSPYTALATPSKHAYPLIWNVQNTNDYYVGRQPLIKELYNFFHKKGAEISIVGSAGIGKTQLAKKYAEIYRGKYDIIWWFDVGKNMDEQYVKLVNEWNRINDNSKVHINLYLPQDEIIRQMKNNLRITELNWLFIFDNVTDKNQISAYIPSKHNKSLGHILITSKNPYTCNHVMKLEKFTRLESIELIRKITKENDTESANQLAEIMGDYPLAIAQAASYIKSSPGLSIKEYTKLFLSSREKLWAEEDKTKSKHAAFDNYNHTVFATLSLIVDEIKKESAKAFELLVFCSYLSSKSIPESLLSHYNTHILQADTLSFRNSLSILGKYSLINLNTSTQKESDDHTFTIHELSQLTVQDMLTTRDKRKELKKALVAMISFLPEKLDDLTFYLSENNYFLSNMESIATYATQLEVYNNDLLRLELRILDYILPGKRDFTATAKSIDKINQLLLQVSNPNPLLRARFAVMNSLFQACHNFDYPTSLKYALDSLAILKAAHQDNASEELLMAYNMLLSLYQIMGEYDQALLYAKQGEDLVNKDTSQGNQDALFGTIARIYTDIGELELALKYSNKAIDKLVNKIENMVAGDILIHMLKPIVLIKMGKYEEAFALLSKIHEFTDKIFGQNGHIHKATVNCYYGYILFMYKNDLIKAKDFLLKSQSIFQEVLGDLSIKNKAFALSYQFLGEIYEKEGNNFRAQQEYAKALQIITNSYNGEEKATDDFSELSTRLAIINAKLKDTVTAQQYLDLHRKVFGHNHHRTMQIIEYFVDNKLSVGF